MAGFWDSLPILRKTHRAAVTNGVYPWGLLGAVPLLTGLIGSCPVYTLLGVGTKSAKKANG